MIQTDHDKDKDFKDADGNITEHPRRLGREQAPPKRFKNYEVYVTVEEEEECMPIGLAGNVANMLATCWPNSQMSAFSAFSALSCRHKTDPDTAFLCRGWPTFTPFFF